MISLRIQKFNQGWVFISIVFWHIYALTRLAADHVHGRASWLRYGFDVAFAGSFTILWALAMTRRLTILGMSRWWLLPYLLLMSALTFVFTRANALSIAIAVVVWLCLNLVLVLRPPKKKPEVEGTPTK
jgi:hypothetical protein